jgi:hypothetical protein
MIESGMLALLIAVLVISIYVIRWRVPSSPPESRLIPCEAQVG